MAPCCILLLILAILLSTYPAHFCTATSENDEFIRTSCGATRYPELCYSTLSPYAADVGNSFPQLVTAALRVAQDGAVSTCSAVRSLARAGPRRMKGSELAAGAVSDCVGNMKDSVDQLKDSMAAMKGLDHGPDFAMELGNMQTWVSAALTDEDTCVDGLEGSAMNGKVRDEIRRRVVWVAQLTSNSLALINRL
ncbi:unnamed protein product [Linum tenue]|uniref:Pectinesterase inhibitor domain-containing protein n=1 Tax=Linum tenue TaxID=586396 RepID=A0AAV0J4S9_9ROSI|nr:unnamed protein product [Linum tenue]